MNEQKCRVVHCKQERYDVYIGRPSIWGNPFTHRQDVRTLARYIVANRAAAVKAYKHWITEGDGKHLLSELYSLRGKVLGCWCKPDSCHGDILAELVNNLTGLSDTSLMPYGKHKGVEMANVPADYLLWLYDNDHNNDKCSADVKAYVEDNLDILRKEAT